VLVFRDTPAGAAATFRVTPRAGRTAFAGVREEAILVRLAAAPVDGAANEALVAFLAAVLGFPLRDVSIAAGARGPTKRVVVSGATAGELNARLAPMLPQR
jgi:uncharacterized protein YggU (UPF0235/DUF167 family)